MGKKKEPKGIAFVYVGKGWVPGVPARDLTWEEAEQIGVDVIREMLDPHTGEAMYEEVKRDA